MKYLIFISLIISSIAYGSENLILPDQKKPREVWGELGFVTLIKNQEGQLILIVDDHMYECREIIHLKDCLECALEDVNYLFYKEIYQANLLIMSDGSRVFTIEGHMYEVKGFTHIPSCPRCLVD